MLGLKFTQFQSELGVWTSFLFANPPSTFEKLLRHFYNRLAINSYCLYMQLSSRKHTVGAPLVERDLCEFSPLREHLEFVDFVGMLNVN